MVTSNSSTRPFSGLFRSVARTGRSLLEIAGDAIGKGQLILGMRPSVILTGRMAMEQWKHALNGTPVPKGRPILVFAIRNPRWVEWAVFSSCYLVRLGHPVVLVFSTREIDSIYPGDRRQGFSFWGGVGGIRQFCVEDLDEYVDKGDRSGHPYGEFAKCSAHMVAAYDLKVEEYEGDEEGKYAAVVESAERMLMDYGRAVERLARKLSPVRIVCPSGLIGLSIAVREACHREGVDAFFIEGWAMRPGHNIWNLNRPALEYDIGGWKRVLGEWTSDKERDAADYMRFREGSRVSTEDWLDNFHQVQRSRKEDPLPPGVEEFLGRPGKKVLLGTNVVGDSSTLGRATIFRSQKEWVSEVIRFFRERPGLSLVIRAHPDEVWQKAKTRIGDVAAEMAKDIENVLVVPGTSDVNTFSLMERSDAGLAWVSNFGLDMALRGKPVILAAAARYAFTGICLVPKTREEYFEEMGKVLEAGWRPQAQAITEAKMYHHIVFKRMSLKADSENYRSAHYRLREGGMTPDQDRFYRILAGELSDKGESRGGIGTARVRGSVS